MKRWLLSWYKWFFYRPQLEGEVSSFLYEVDPEIEKLLHSKPKTVGISLATKIAIFLVGNSLLGITMGILTYTVPDIIPVLIHAVLGYGTLATFLLASPLWATTVGVGLMTAVVVGTCSGFLWGVSAKFCAAKQEGISELSLQIPQAPPPEIITEPQDPSRVIFDVTPRP